MITYSLILIYIIIPTLAIIALTLGIIVLINKALGAIKEIKDKIKKGGK